MSVSGSATVSPPVRTLQAAASASDRHNGSPEHEFTVP